MARNYGRDLDIGYPDIMELKDIHNKLDEVETKIKETTSTLDGTNFELKKISLGTGLIIDEDIEEVVE